MLWLVCFDMDLVCIIYNVLSGHIISYFKRSKRVNEQIICLCTSSEENWFTCQFSGSLVLWLVCFDMDLVCIIMYCLDT